MYCIISETALYSEIEQRPLAALLIHVSPPLSFVGMPNSVQSAVFKNSSSFRPTRRWSVLVSSLLLLSLRTAVSPATLLWRMRSVHAALVTVVAKVCWMWTEHGRAERREALRRWACVWVKRLDSDSERPAQRIKCSTAEQLSTPPKICVPDRGGPRMGRAAAQSWALTVTESCCVYTAQGSTIPAVW